MTPYLAPDEPRCRPASPCATSDICGRYLAALPDRGATVMDFSKLIVGLFCPSFIPLSECRVPSAAPRPVHPAIGSDEA